MSPTKIMPLRSLMLGLPLIAISVLTACSSAPLVVQPAQPLPPPHVAIPAFLQACPPVVSWLSQTLTCKPAPGR